MINFYKNMDGGYKVIADNGVSCGDLLCKEDGFYDWWPNNKMTGYLPAYFLHEVANKLDELNAPMEKQLEEYFNANTSRHKGT